MWLRMNHTSVLFYVFLIGYFDQPLRRNRQNNDFFDIYKVGLRLPCLTKMDLFDLLYSTTTEHVTARSKHSNKQPTFIDTRDTAGGSVRPQNAAVSLGCPAATGHTRVYSLIMWGSTFADLAKKAHELQEQAKEQASHLHIAVRCVFTSGLCHFLSLFSFFSHTHPHTHTHTHI
jgi:hypothetical protein